MSYPRLVFGANKKLNGRCIDNHTRVQMCNLRTQYYIVGCTVICISYNTRTALQLPAYPTIQAQHYSYLHILQYKNTRIQFPCTFYNVIQYYSYLHILQCNSVLQLPAYPTIQEQHYSYLHILQYKHSITVTCTSYNTRIQEYSFHAHSTM